MFLRYLYFKVCFHIMILSGSDSDAKMDEMFLKLHINTVMYL